MSGAFSKLDHATSGELEQHVLACNYPKVERVTKRLARAALLSSAMEHLLTAECEFESRLVNYSLPLEVEHSQDVFRFGEKSLDHAITTCQRGLREATGNVEETLLLNCVLGKCLVLKGDYQEALGTVYCQISDEDMGALYQLPLDMEPASNDASLTIDAPDEDGKRPVTRSLQLVPRLFALQAALCKAIALEMTGRGCEALIPYAAVTDACRRTGSGLFLCSRSLILFAGLAMYRYGLLCMQFAADPSCDMGKHSQAEATEHLRGKFYFDAAVSLRLFLTFHPVCVAFGKIRHELALKGYMQALESHFRRSNYKGPFDPEQQGQHSLMRRPQGDKLFSPADEGSLHNPFCPESVAEDIIDCTLQIEALQPLEPTSKGDAQKGASSDRVRRSIARLAIHGSRSSLVQLCQSLFARYAADASTYARLILALASAQQYDQVVRAGEIYSELGGSELSVISVIAKACLCFPCKSDFAIRMLEKHVNPSAQDSIENSLMRNVLRKLLGLSYLQKADHSTDLENLHSFLDISMETLERAVVTDENDPEAHLYLSLAYLRSHKLTSAESSIAVSLSIEPDQPVAWTLFAIIKTALKDYEICLEIIGTFQENYQYLTPSMLLLKSAVMALLGGWDEAAQTVMSMIGAFSEAAGPVVQPEGASEISSVVSVAPSTNESLALEPANFRAKFFPPSEFPSFASSVSVSRMTQIIPPAQRYGLTMSAYKEAFPEAPTRVIARKMIARELFPESVISSLELYEFLSRDALFNVTRGPLLATQLWCSLGEIYVSMGRLHQAELCAHEAFLHSELDARIYHLRGLLCERHGRWKAALECYQLGLLMHESIDCRLGCARCYPRLEAQNDGLQLAWHSLLVAVEANGENVSLLRAAAEVAEKLRLDSRAEELYKRALVLEPTDPIVSSKFYIPLVLQSTIQ